MHVFDYSFLDNGLLPVDMVNIVSSRRGDAAPMATIELV